ncbi:MAG: hypothetical protein HS111_03110 [Kofleriaceae bacterium]|nr:hypothetical protein [Kofleriaceae bacterium]
MRGTAACAAAPEQVRGEPWTGAVDVFALGVMLWELSTGERLFHRGASFLSMAAVIEHAPAALADPAMPSPPRWPPRSPPILRRASSAAELAAALASR